MQSLPEHPNLKEINAYKRKLNWGEVPAIYHMVASSIGEVDGILTHGFDSAYKQILNKNTWNLKLLGGERLPTGEIVVQNKPQIALRHTYNKMGYELHCFPIALNEKVNRTLVKSPHCPFKEWHPETMRMLFRVNSLPSYLFFTHENGDEADVELVKYAFRTVSRLIKILEEDFEIVEIRGYSIAEFYKEVDHRIRNNSGYHDVTSGLIESPDDTTDF
ncbi:hypothetical protein LP316_12865 [Thalassotalea sp. LPB0316]|uniref:hypothetical protein n=1 Tax=Thalassotalea sp. LPB0316 TaxID=2769490 RepID=UPI001865E138|nr:hypothetical protein [Thalassotalea sp. LPB0316]QOL25182.1 hypothetical protein LP316_12865 [Thalassotalea sp. LPB0316]